MGGAVGSILDPIIGGAPEAQTSGAFPGLGELGGEFQQFLMERLSKPADQTKAFATGSKVIRDTVGRSAATARQRLGDRATTGGFLDSGSVDSFLQDIERGAQSTEAAQLQQLFLQLEDRREQNVMPFLSQGAGEFGNVQKTNVESQTARFGQLTGLAGDLILPF